MATPQHIPFLEGQDDDIYTAIRGEEKRQEEGLELIPSENYVSLAVREASGSIFTNKYSEGYPGKRYYGGQEFTDSIEDIARNRAKKIFNCEYANVQPHAGANANIAAYFALLEPGDTVLGMDLSHGGHLTHGHPVTYITKIFNFVRYKMKDTETGEIDYEEMRDVALREKPKILLAGYSAYSRELDYKKMADIAKEVGAISLMDAAHIAGLIAGGVHENPFDHGFDVMTTTTHKTLRGPRGGMILVKSDEEIAKKIDKSLFPGLQGGPLMHQIAAKAVAFDEVLHPSFKEYAAQMVKNAAAMAEVFEREEVRMLGGGTSNHLILADITNFGIDGHTAEVALDEVGITLNKNMIADDPNPPMRPSGIRFGTPAITTRGFTEKECARVAELMIEVLRSHEDDSVKKQVHEEIKALAAKFPVPDKHY
ncbi:serine hydroxymethyltransferase [Candidatus Kaiserbacteria bacterium]|nr:MAG: serine hydroxymethyltransferase [Candidatus Kaiserbacteria bacterium]